MNESEPKEAAMSETEGREDELPSEQNPIEDENPGIAPEDPGPDEETGPSPSPGRAHGGGVARGGTPGGGAAAD
jgi:hypothetical protein